MTQFFHLNVPETQQGRRILVVDDEILISMHVELLLLRLGCKVVKTGTVDAASRLVETEHFDGALLDVTVGGKPIYPLMDKLRARQIPFALVTGHDADRLPADYRDCPIVPKPIVELQFAQVVRSLVSRAAMDLTR